MEVDYDIFENVRPPDPNQHHAAYHAVDLDYTLKPKAVDAKVRLPTCES